MDNKGDFDKEKFLIELIAYMMYERKQKVEDIVSLIAEKVTDVDKFLNLVGKCVARDVDLSTLDEALKLYE